MKTLLRHKFALPSLPALAACLLLPPSWLGAQEPGEPAIPEEIVINAPESLRDLRLEIRQAQIDMFNVFNELNDDDKFDVHCYYERRRESKIRQQVCRPVFMSIALEQEANFLLLQQGYVGGENGLPGVTQVNHYNGLFEKKMEAIFREQPAFRQAVQEFNTLNEYFEEQRSLRFGD